jgi:hypothetical protein
MRLLQTITTLLTLALTTPTLALRPLFPLSPNNGPKPAPSKRDTATYAPPTWDNASLFLLGQRAMLFSGEFHPFRLPVPSLWRDVLEKIKALGLNTVSFCVPWALLEGKPGEFRAEGVFDLAEFFAAAKELGVWLVARPGPYISEYIHYFPWEEVTGVMGGKGGMLLTGSRWRGYRGWTAWVASED